MLPPVGGAAGAPGAIADCNRACLMDALSGYLKALAARDVKMIKVSPSVKVTENGVVQMFGSGLWQTATAIRANTRLDFADPLQGQVGSQLLVEEGGAPVLLQVRLKLVKHEITELETLVMRQGDGLGFDPDGMTPAPIFGEQVPVDKRMTRDAMKATTDPYLDALESGNFSKIKFDEKVIRKENGTQTSDYDGFKKRSTDASAGREIGRRYLVFDQEYGLVFGIFPFTSSADAMVASEVFKVQDGKIMMINVVLTTMPAKAWD